jgi:hypothetical protein
MGSLPNLSCSAYQPSTAPGTVTESDPNAGTVLRSPSLRFMPASVSPLGERPDPL